MGNSGTARQRCEVVPFTRVDGTSTPLCLRGEAFHPADSPEEKGNPRDQVDGNEKPVGDTDMAMGRRIAT
jgi:hypothetical protein